MKIYVFSIIFWVGIYLLLGYISLQLDNPHSRVEMVWFPAGAAVCAGLSIPRRLWPHLFFMFFITRTILDVLIRHSLETSLILSLISISGDFIIAGAVQFWGDRHDNLRKVCVWLSSTFIVCTFNAMLVASWLSTRHELNFFDTASLWWAANVSGIIVTTTVLTGLFRKRFSLTFCKISALVICISFVSACVVWVFNSPPVNAESAGLVYGLTCIPVFLVIIIHLIADNQAGAFSFLALCIGVIFFSWQRTGPFFINGLEPGEPLLIAQCYLSGAAVLMIFIRQLLYLSAGQSEDKKKRVANEIAFRMDTTTGALDWDLSVDSSLHQLVTQFTDRNNLLRSVTPDIAEQLLRRWESVISGSPVDDMLVFQVTFPDGTRHAVGERRLFYLYDQHKGFVVGYWAFVSGYLPLSSME